MIFENVTLTLPVKVGIDVTKLVVKSSSISTQDDLNRINHNNIIKANEQIKIDADSSLILRHSKVSSKLIHNNGLLQIVRSTIDASKILQYANIQANDSILRISKDGVYLQNQSNTMLTSCKLKTTKLFGRSSIQLRECNVNANEFRFNDSVINFINTIFDIKGNCSLSGEVNLNDVKLKVLNSLIINATSAHINNVTLSAKIMHLKTHHSFINKISIKSDTLNLTNEGANDINNSIINVKNLFINGNYQFSGSKISHDLVRIQKFTLLKKVLLWQKKYITWGSLILMNRHYFLVHY